MEVLFVIECPSHVNELGKALTFAFSVFIPFYCFYRKYPNLERTQVEIISDTNYLVRILFERSFSRHLI